MHNLSAFLRILMSPWRRFNTWKPLSWEPVAKFNLGKEMFRKLLNAGMPQVWQILGYRREITCNWDERRAGFVDQALLEVNILISMWTLSIILSFNLVSISCSLGWTTWVAAISCYLLHLSQILNLSSPQSFYPTDGCTGNWIHSHR